MIMWHAPLGVGKPQSFREALERVSVPAPPFLGNLSIQALNLRQEAGSGYQEWGLGRNTLGFG